MFGSQDDDKAHSIFFGFVDKITFDNRPQIYMHNSILGTSKKCFKTRGSPGYKSTFYYTRGIDLSSVSIFLLNFRTVTTV
jgi:hypothetical protein